MLTIETLAEIDGQGRLTANTSQALAPGTHRVTIVVDERVVQAEANKTSRRDLAAFRASLGARPYPGNSVVDLRAEERA